MITSLSAVTLCVSEMTRSLAFYEALGFRIRYGGAAADFTSFHAGDSYLNLMLRAGYHVETNWGRVIFYVDDVDATWRQMREAGYAPEFEPRDAEWGERYFHILDPDGNEISLAHLLPARP